MSIKIDKDYYIKKKTKLMKDFNKYIFSIPKLLEEKYDDAKIDKIIKQMNEEFETLIPKIPYIGGTKNYYTRVLVQIISNLAIFLVFEKEGLTYREIGELFYEFVDIHHRIRKERFEKVHDVNIQRLQGNYKYYFGIDIDFSDLPLLYQLFLKTCYNLGIHAAEKQRIHVLSPFQRLRTLSLYKQYETMMLSPYYAYYDVFQQIENVSTYLLEQQNLSQLCLHDGTLLKEESIHWKKIVIYFMEIQEVNLNNSLIKTLMLTNPIFDEIVKTIDEIIDIEKEILNNNLKRDNANHMKMVKLS